MGEMRVMERQRVIDANDFLDAIEEAEEDDRKEAEQLSRPRNRRHGVR